MKTADTVMNLFVGGEGGEGDDGKQLLLYLLHRPPREVAGV